MAGGLLVLTALHDLDHIRQGRALALELYGVAVVAVAMTTAVLMLVMRGHPLGQLATIGVGLATVFGVGIVHVAPEHSYFSDPYAAGHADALSWTIIILMMITGLGMATVGFACHRKSVAR